VIIFSDRCDRRKFLIYLEGQGLVMPRERMLKDDILKYLKETGRPVSFPSLYDQFKSRPKSSIRVAVYRLVTEGLVVKVSHKPPVSYKAK
jgi:hypothetical protein